MLHAKHRRVKRSRPPRFPATGTTIGLERIIDVMQELGMLQTSASGTQLLLAVFDASTRDAALGLGA